MMSEAWLRRKECPNEKEKQNNCDPLHRRRVPACASESERTRNEAVGLCAADCSRKENNNCRGAVVKQQRAIGNNLNQLTRLANQGEINVIDLKAMVREYSAVTEMIAEVLKEVK